MKSPKRFVTPSQLDARVPLGARLDLHGSCSPASYGRTGSCRKGRNAEKRRLALDEIVQRHTPVVSPRLPRCRCQSADTVVRASSRTTARRAEWRPPPGRYEPQRGAPSDLQEKARRHLWMHFTRMGGVRRRTRSRSSCAARARYVYDEHGKRYLDGLSALFCVNAGHGRAELGDAAAAQAKELGFYTNWSYAHPRGDRAGRAHRGRSPRATSTACSSPRAARRRSSRPGSWRASTTSSPASPRRPRSSRARPPTTAPPSARSRSPGITPLRTPFEPLVPGAHHVPNTNELPLARGPRPALGRRRRSST